MTEQLKQLANEAKRFDGGDWYLAKHLVTDWKMDKQDAAYIAAASPDVVLGLIAERDEYQRAADAMAASHKVERDALLDSRHADEALMREALEMCEAVLCNYVCRGTHEETVKHNAAIDAVRARLGGV